MYGPDHMRNVGGMIGRMAMNNMGNPGTTTPGFTPYQKWSVGLQGAGTLLGGIGAFMNARENRRRYRDARRDIKYNRERNAKLDPARQAILGAFLGGR